MEPHYYITEITCQMVEYDYDSTDGIEYEQYGYGGYFPYPFTAPNIALSLNAFSSPL